MHCNGIWKQQKVQNNWKCAHAYNSLQMPKKQTSVSPIFAKHVGYYCTKGAYDENGKV